MRQRQTAPDSALSRADAIELADITPDVLRERLAAGNVFKVRTSRPGASWRCAARPRPSTTSLRGPARDGG